MNPTDPAGSSFLSYNHQDIEIAKEIIYAQRERGIPTWRDADDLGVHMIEKEVRDQLNDPCAANAVTLISPDALNSTFIKEIEIPLILQRAERQESFFVVPCAIGGLDYQGAAKGVGATSTQSLLNWRFETQKKGEEPSMFAVRVAKRVLEGRIKAIHKALPPDEPLNLSVYTRGAAPSPSGQAFLFDWTHHYEGRIVNAGAYENKLWPALQDVVAAIQKHAAGRRVAITGNCSLSAAFLFGVAFMQPTYIDAGWLQTDRDTGKSELWVRTSREDHGFEIEVSPGKPGQKDLAVLVPITAEVKEAVDKSGFDDFRAVIRINKHSPFPHSLNPRQAAQLAKDITDAIRNARAEYKTTQTHLFVASPVGLMCMIGQLTNTLGEIRTYEYSNGLYTEHLKLYPGG